MAGISQNCSRSLRFVGVLLLCSLCAIVLAPPASADTLYSYTGNPFTSFQGTDACTAGVGECQISLSFTLALPLPANFGSEVFSLTQVTPLSFSMADGVHTLTQFNSSPYFLVGTNSSGQITRWSISPFNSAEPNVFIVTAEDPPFLTTVDSTNTFGFVVSEFGFASNLNSPGTWTISTVPHVPEPSSLFLLGSGLLGLANGLRRKSLGAGSSQVGC